MGRLNLGPITAYAIAVKHGFKGTEEEWIASALKTVDSELSETSENPLQNKVITKALNEKVDKVIEETETAKNKAEIALISAEQAEQNAKDYTDKMLADKVDKVKGKGLSTNDYNATDKAKVDKLKTNGASNKFLNEQGEYVEVEGGSGGGSNVEIVQEKGTSTTAVMSQKAVTEELGDAENALDNIIELQEAYIGGSGSDKVLSTNDYTDTDKAKVDKLKTNGASNKFLNEQGEYVEVEGGSGGGSNVEIVQEKGTSTTAVMSQKAVTEELGDAENALDNIIELQEAYIGGGGSDKVLSTNDYTDTDKEKVNKIITNGDGNSYLANDGTYKPVQSGGVDEGLIYSNYKSVIFEINLATYDKYNVGQKFLFVGKDALNLQIIGTISMCAPYSYISEDDIINTLKTNGQIIMGHYILAPLNIQYAFKEDVQELEKSIPTIYNHYITIRRIVGEQAVCTLTIPKANFSNEMSFEDIAHYLGGNGFSEEMHRLHPALGAITVSGETKNIIGVFGDAIEGAIISLCTGFNAADSTWETYTIDGTKEEVVDRPIPCKEYISI